MPTHPLKYGQPAWNLDARLCVVLGAFSCSGSRVACRARPVRMIRHAQNSNFSSSLVFDSDQSVLLHVVLGVRFPAAGSRVAFRARPARMIRHAQNTSFGLGFNFLCNSDALLYVVSSLFLMTFSRGERCATISRDGPCESFDAHGDRVFEDQNSSFRSDGLETPCCTWFWAHILFERLGYDHQPAP